MLRGVEQKKKEKIASRTIHMHHKIAYLYFKYLQFIDLMLGHKINQTFILYVLAINSVKITCFLEIL